MKPMKIEACDRNFLMIFFVSISLLTHTVVDH